MNGYYRQIDLKLVNSLGQRKKKNYLYSTMISSRNPV